MHQQPSKGGSSLSHYLAVSQRRHRNLQVEDQESVLSLKGGIPLRRVSVLNLYVLNQQGQVRRCSPAS